MSDFRTKQRRIRREEQERAISMEHYIEHKEDFDMFHEACAIISTLSRISYNARELTAEDILSKVISRTELDFYYRWCSKLC